MRAIELCLICILAVHVVLLFVPAKRRYRWMHILPFLSITLVILHLLIEGYRWQIVPAYLLSALTALFAMTNVRRSIRSSEQSVLTDRKWLSGVIGKIEGKRCMRILNAYALAFFNKHLKGQDSSLLDGSSREYPEVEIHIGGGSDF